MEKIREVLHMEEINKIVGKKFKEIREEYKYSLREVAKYTGIDHSHISKIENGQRNTTLDVIEKLCRFYKINVSDLFGDGVEIPDELKELGVEWIAFAKDLKRSKLTMDEIKKAVEFVNGMKKHK